VRLAQIADHLVRAKRVPGQVDVRTTLFLSLSLPTSTGSNICLPILAAFFRCRLSKQSLECGQRIASTQFFLPMGM
jgi:hypothetical protein